MQTPVAAVATTSTAIVGPPRHRRKPYSSAALTQMRWRNTASHLGTSNIATRLSAAKTPQVSSCHGTTRPAGRTWSGGVEPITLAPHSDDRVGAELLPQPRDVDVDHVGPGVEPVAPDLRQQVLLGDRAAGVTRQLPQQQELPLRQRHELRADPHLPAHEVHAEPADLERRGAPAGSPDAQPDALQQLVEAERLGHVVVGAELEALDLGPAVRQAREDDDHLLRPTLHQAAQDREAGQVRGRFAAPG